MKPNRYISLIAALALPLALVAQTITFDTEDAEYNAIGVYDTWENSPFRTNEMEGRTAVVTNHLNQIDDLLGEAANATGKMLAVQRSRFGSNTFGVRIDLKEPLALTTTTQYVHALIHKPVAGRTLLVGLGKRNDRPEQPQDVEQFWELSSADLVANKWQDAVYAIKGAGNISIYSLVFVVDCESPHNLTEDFIAYIDEIEINNSAAQRIVYTDYAINYEKNANHTHSSRWIKSIGFNGSSDGNQSIVLNTASNKQLYYNRSEDKPFTAKVGDSITPTFTMNGNWMNGYVYLDRGNDGRFHAKINEDLTITEGSDIMTYSFYTGSSNDANGINSNGVQLSGNERNALNPPAFKIPADLKNGFYRLRYKIDWNSVDPGGSTMEGNTITEKGGAIVDVRLNIHEETTKISAHQRNCELLSAETGEGLGGTVVPFGKDYKIKVVPANGFAYRGVTVVHGYNIVIDPNQDYAVTSDQYIHETKQYSIDYIPAAQFDDNNECIIPAEYIDGEVHVIADVVSGYSVKYKHILNGEVANTEVLITTDGTFPTPSQPWGITLGKLPTGTVTENCIREVEVTFDSSVLPFIAASSYEEITNWYYMTLNNKYLFYQAGATSIPLNKDEVDNNNKDAYTFAFVGNPYSGYQIVNYAAGEGFILSSSTTMSGTTGGSTYPVMTATPVPEGNNTGWLPSRSTHATNGFYLEQKGFSSNKLNNRDNKVAYWTAGYDAGSTLLVSERKMGKLGEIEDAIDDLKETKIAGTDPGYYTEESIATLYGVVEQANKLTDESTSEEISAISDALNSATETLQANVPVKGCYYILKSAFPGWTTGDKAMFSDGNTIKWKDVNYNDASFFWLLEDIKNGKYIFKNAGDSKYMSGKNMSATAPANGATLTMLATGQYNIISENTILHTEGHSGGSGENGNIVSWNAGANSCSAWHLLTADTPTATGNVNITYNYVNNSNVWHSEEKSVAINTPHATPASAFGAEAMTLKGYGLAREGQQSIDVICTLNGELPFEFEQQWNRNGNWYYLTLDTRNNFYLKHTANTTSITLNTTTLPTDEELLNAFTFAFIGNPYLGYKIVNYAAGEGYILSSPTTMSGNTGSGTFPIMTDENNKPANNNTYWIASKSEHANGGFYLEQKGYTNNKMNYRDGKLAFWSTGKDMGSTFVASKRIIESSDEETAIDGVSTDENRGAHGIYNLSGRRFDKAPEKGVYIVDGVKTIIK